ncbi:hypothetical protein BV898_00081 [Hypsibius exemplaris]|uniref:Uncharacterized protein n=1 Tax=Hypsibius exemplaris TaxID=2072580 RepID=A0A1W0XEN9_HYPEX|nr:hypothetical protein BV898_00081 [Hypsibius exemplaris]
MLTEVILKMEPFGHPNDLRLPVKIASGSAVESFLKLGKAPALAVASQPSQTPSQESTEASKQIDELNGRFKAALKTFQQAGDSASFAKQIEDVSALGLALVPMKKAYIKSIEAVLMEYLEAEDRGGLPKDIIREVVEECHAAHRSLFELVVDRAVIKDFLTLLRKNQLSQPSSSQSRPPTERARAFGDSDDEIEAEDVGEEEENEDDGPIPGASQHHLEETAEETEDAIREELSEPGFLENKRAQIAAVTISDAAYLKREMEKTFEKVRNKRGYSWSLVEGVIVEGPSDDSIQVRPTTADKIIQDPISKTDITVCAVKSSNCPSSHLYEESNLRPLVRNAQQKDARGIKCSYLGCGMYIRMEDIISDDEYARFLARTAQEDDVEP